MMYELEWTSETSIFHNDVLGEDIGYHNRLSNIHCYTYV